MRIEHTTKNVRVGLTTTNRKRIRHTAEDRHRLYAQLPDPAAREELIESHYGHVIRIADYWAKKYNVPLDEAIQDGLVGFMEALDDFKPELGNHLTTYSQFRVLRAVQAGWEKRASLMTPYRRVYRRRKGTHLPGQPGVESLENNSDDDTPAPIDSLAAKQDESPDPFHVRDMARSILELPEIVREVIRLRFWCDKTLQETGSEIGKSREWVRKTEIAAVEYLRLRLSGKHVKFDIFHPMEADRESDSRRAAR